MKLRHAWIVSILTAVFTGIVAFRFPAVFLGFAATGGGIGGVSLSSGLAAAVTFLAVYGALTAGLSALGLARDLRRVGQRLDSSGRRAADHPLSVADWHDAFSGTAVEPIADRLLVRGGHRRRDLLLAAPFSPRDARAEIRALHIRRLSAAQVWTAALCLIGLGFLGLVADGPSLGFGDTLAVRALFAGAFVVLVTVSSRSVVDAAIEGVVAAISGIASQLRTSAGLQEIVECLQAQYVALARLPDAAARAVTTEMGGFLQQMAALADRTATVDHETLRRSVEHVTDSFVSRLDDKIATPLQAAESLMNAANATTAELHAQFRELPQILERQSHEEHERSVQFIHETATMCRDLVEHMSDQVHKAMAEAAEASREELRRIAAAVDDDREQMVQSFAAAQAELGSQHRDSVATIERMAGSVEALGVRLAPAIRRLEASDDRLQAALARQDQALDGMGRLIGELSGTLQAMQVILENLSGRSVPLAGEASSATIRRTPMVHPIGLSDATGTTALQQIASLLEEMEEANPSTFDRNEGRG